MAKTESAKPKSEKMKVLKRFFGLLRAGRIKGKKFSKGFVKSAKSAAEKRRTPEAIGKRTKKLFQGLRNRSEMGSWHPAAFKYKRDKKGNILPILEPKSAQRKIRIINAIEGSAKKYGIKG